MKTPLAWLNLLHNPFRSLVAIAGVAFAVVLIFMQLGFYGAVLLSATCIYDQLDFDAILLSRHYRVFSSPGTYPLDRLALLSRLGEVESTTTLQVGLHGWLNRAAEPLQRRGLLVMAIRPGESAFRLSAVRQHESQFTSLGNVLFDTRSREEFGPRDVGIESEIGAQRVRIIGAFTLGSGFSADGAVITGENTFRRIFDWRDPLDTNLGLIRLRDEVDPEAFVERHRTWLPEDVELKSRSQLLLDEQQHWVLKTAVGVIFGLGVVIALIVGTGVVFQVLASDIGNRLGEYATLKALGYESGYLARSVLTQATLLAVGGFVPGWLIAIGLYALTREQAHVPMELSPTLAAAVLGLSVVMCAVSAWMALRRVTHADPADLF